MTTSTPDDDRQKGPIILGASRQMSLTQAVAYWKGRAEMAERRNLLNPEGSEYVAELEARLEELERERDEWMHGARLSAARNVFAEARLDRQQAVIEAAREHLDAMGQYKSKYAPGPPPWPIPTGSVADTSRRLHDALADLGQNRTENGTDLDALATLTKEDR